ncbi:MAG: MmgE/PrpD family protein, partial [Acidimicrobiia bacterium]|nr:MmgE/PrpD family protein [Acidimicrobiia bacterium]
LLGLDVEQTVSAMGIAATMASGSMQFLLDGAWTKRFHPAHAARDGIEAALMAEAGYKGTKDGIGGDRGFLAGYSSDPQPKEILADWGFRPLEVRNTSIKAHTCCRYKQGPIDGLIEIRRSHDIKSEDVTRMRVGILSVADEIISSPEDLKRRPTTIVDAQFSMPYGAAVAISRGAASLAEYDGSLFDDPEILRLMDLTESVVDTDLDLSYPAQWRAWSEVTTKSGDVFRAEVNDPKGDPTNPMSPAENVAKFQVLTSHAYSTGRREALVAAVSEIGRKTSFSQLIDLLPADLD